MCNGFDSSEERNIQYFYVLALATMPQFCPSKQWPDNSGKVGIALQCAALYGYSEKPKQIYNNNKTSRSLVKIWEREKKQINGSYSALESNFSCGLGGIDPGGDVKHEPHGRLYPANVSHPHQGGKLLLCRVGKRSLMIRHCYP